MVHSVISLNIILRRLYINSNIYDCCFYPSTDRYGDTSILKQNILSSILTTVFGKGVKLVGNASELYRNISHRFGRCTVNVGSGKALQGLGSDASSSSTFYMTIGY